MAGGDSVAECELQLRERGILIPIAMLILQNYRNFRTSSAWCTNRVHGPQRARAKRRSDLGLPTAATTVQGPADLPAVPLPESQEQAVGKHESSVQ
jgi:hypothetical protein